jgi:hypothetical protein
MLTAKIENALAGNKGRHRPGPGDADYIDHPTRRLLEDLVLTSGVGTEDGRVYVARRLRWLLGKGDVPICPAALTRDVGFLDRRAIELIDGNRHRLPAPDERRMQTP